MSKLTYPGLTVPAMVLVLLSACTDAPEAVRPSPATVTAPEPAGRDTVTERCGPPATPAKWINLRGPDGSKLVAAVVGQGPTTAVFAHQTSGSGLCGFWAYAAWLAERHGVRSLLVDLCGYGESDCREGRFARDEPAQIWLAVRWVRQHGARNTTLVGASLGGTVVSAAAARIRPAVQGLVNLSGPVRYVGINVAAIAPQITAPSLFAIAPTDRVATVASYRQVVNALGAETKRLFIAPFGHGWTMLGVFIDGEGFRATRLGQAVAEWITLGG